MMSDKENATFVFLNYLDLLLCLTHDVKYAEMKNTIEERLGSE